MPEVRQARLGDAGISPPPAAIEKHSTAFRVDVAPERGAVRLSPVGEVDIATVGRVREQLDERTAAGFERVIFDLRGATFIDSTGSRLIVAAHAASADEGCELTIIPGPQAVQRPFDIAGLNGHLPFADPAPTARGSLWS